MNETAVPTSTPAPTLDTSELKRFGPEARQQLLDIVDTKLDRVLAEGSLPRRESAAAVAELEKQIEAASRDQVIEQVAYTWFNRFCALRFMDANRYTPIGVVSPADGLTQPEILLEAKQGFIDPQWNADNSRIMGLLDGSIASDAPQSEAYQLLLIAVCNSYHSKMPFLFERIADYTELLIPDDLLSDSSILSAMRQVMTTEACQSVEIIGWLYQFYISEKKDEVIGKVVKSEDIPAATQLFTPNWIVKYMVQNSLGAQWLATYPNSPLKGQMEYYIEPAEQTDEVKVQLAAITPSQLNPEELTLIDPASGSGHILVEAYELFKAIYLERGYRQRDVPQLILTQNLFGLDIDERAAQLTGFALMMKGRADDRRLFERGVRLNVMALVDSAGFDAEALAKGVELSDYGLKPGDLTELKRLFEHATTFGSLIEVPEGLSAKLQALKQLSEATSQDLFVSEALKRLGPLVQQAELLAAQYDAVVANPPYMGSKYQTKLLKQYLQSAFPDGKADIYAALMTRWVELVQMTGLCGIVTRDTWMFQPTFLNVRMDLIDNRRLVNLAYLGPRAFESISGEVVRAVAFVTGGNPNGAFKPTFIRLDDGSAVQKRRWLSDGKFRNHDVRQDAFAKIPGAPLAFWAGEHVRDLFVDFPKVGEFGETRAGLQTDDNARFLRWWHEVPYSKIGFGCADRSQSRASGKKWFPHVKGGDFRRWSGNGDYVVNWEDDGRELFDFLTAKHGSPTKSMRSLDKYFRSGSSWGLTGNRFSARELVEGTIFNVQSPTLFVPDSTQFLPFLNSNVCQFLLELSNPGLSFIPSTIAALPYAFDNLGRKSADVATNCRTAIWSSAADWDAYERSWDFQSLPILTASTEPTPTLESSYTAWTTQNKGTIAEMKRLEEENNRLFIDAYGLADELTPDVPIEQITLTVNPAYRYGGKLSEEEQWTRFRQDTMEELVSYAIGCMMGRYSLDAPGLILANTGESIEDYDRIIKEKRIASGDLAAGEPFQCSFTPDDDNVIPIVDGEWFADDIVGRFKTFLKVTWGEENYEENLRWLEDGLFPKNATARTRKTLRDYFLKDFYKNHVSTYKKRPIYWLFSSPKGTFNALIYMHRYRSDTVSVILNDYLREFQTKLRSKIGVLQTVADNAASAKADKTRAIKEINQLEKQLKELEDYERDVLYPLATRQVEIDLDDGVKVNYNKFGKALKKITGVTGKA